MERKYQVFVSSTYIDLADERAEVMQALLEMDCIPVGMELFPAADDEQWTLIKGLIKGCDYYLLIVGGRYGSTHPKTGMSYTQMEYELALKEKMPIFSFLPKRPGNIPVRLSEKEQLGLEKLLEFKNLVEKKICRYWESPADLGSQVSRSLIKLIKSNPRSGWVKAGVENSPKVLGELVRLSSENSRLQKRVQKLTTDLEKYQSKGTLNVDLSYDGQSLLKSGIVVEIKYFSDGSILRLRFELQNKLNRSLSPNDLRISVLIRPLIGDDGIACYSNEQKADGYVHFDVDLSLHNKILSMGYEKIYLGDFDFVPVNDEFEMPAIIRIMTTYGSRDFDVIFYMNENAYKKYCHKRNFL